MPDLLTFDIPIARLVRKLFDEGPKKVEKELDRVLVDIGRKFERHIVKNRLRGGPSARAVGKRTGQLRNSFGTRALARGLDGIVVVGFGPPATAWTGGAERYAAVHEGLVDMPIEPKRGTYLAIPIAENLTGSGVARIQSPRDLADPEFVPWLFTTGPGFLVFDADQLMFALVLQVRIPARLHFREDWARLKPEYQADIFKAVDRGLNATR